MKLGRKKVILVILMFVFVFVPIPFERVPEFKFILVDDNGHPLSGVTVIEDIDDYTYNLSDSRTRIKSRSGESGNVVFPNRVLWMSVAYRIIRSSLARLMLLAHGSIGVKAEIFVEEDADYWPTNVARWNEDCDAHCDLPVNLTALKKF